MSRAAVLQSNVTDAQQPFLPGNTFNSEYNALTLVAAEALPFGSVVCTLQANQNQCRLPMPNLSTVTFDIDFADANEVAIVVTSAAYNASSATTDDTTVTVSGTDQLATMNAIRTAIEGLIGVSAGGSVSSSFGPNNRTLTVNGDPDTQISLEITVTVGTTPTATQVLGTSDEPVGLAIRPQTAVNAFGTDTPLTYEAGENVAILVQGLSSVYMENVSGSYDQVTNAVIASQGPVFWRFQDNGDNLPGQIRTTNIAGFTKELSTKGIQWRSNYWNSGRLASAAPVGIVNFNLP